ncbi:MAG TPA: aldehyde dehydrogenase family protein, partial [Anaerolineales bacterium]|nr:aldehyde dehydrogenase family protein [Anaerolineales bacterium]
MEILNYINGEWIKPNVKEYFDVINPATGQVIAKTPLCSKADVDAAAQSAREAFDGWRRTPVNDRVQYLFKLRNLMRENGDAIARLITDECGKTFEEAKAEMVRAYENVEVACGMPHMGKGEFVEDIAPGIDEIMIRQPVGVCATIAPF